MNIKTDLTVVVGLDAVTIREWELSLSTHAALKPELLDCRWCVFYDQRAVSSNAIMDLAGHCGLDRSPLLRLVPWPEEEHVDQYGSQRELMLSGFVFVPTQHVQTAWWMKLDADTISTPAEKRWWEDEWFDDECMAAAPAWSYTKAKPPDRSIERWAEDIEAFGDKALPGKLRLGLVEHVSGNKIIYPRFWSPVSFYRTSWTKTVAILAHQHCGPYRIPVPSQDGFHWYCCERGGWKWAAASMRGRGWVKHSRLKNLEAAVAEVLKNVEAAA